MKTNFQKKENVVLYYLLIGFFLLVTFISGAQVGINTTTPKSTFEVNGSLGQTITTVTSNTTLSDAHSIVLCNNGATPISLTLPDVVTCGGRVYSIKKEASSSANVTIIGTIDGTANLILSNTKEAVSIISNGTEWKTINNYNLGSTSNWTSTGNANTNPSTNFIGTTDAKDIVLKTNNTTRAVVSSTGVTTIGNATDYLKIDADGTPSLNGAATVFDDLRVFPDATSKGNSNPPTWSDTAFKKNAANTSQGVFLWMFSSSTEQELYFSVQMPHAYKEGSNLYPHVHWTTATGTPTATNVVWGLEYSVVAVGGNFPVTTILTSGSVVPSIGTPSGVGQHLISPLGSINGSNIGLSTILICRLFRDTTNANDTFANPIGLLSIDFHYEVDSLGSHTEFVK